MIKRIRWILFGIIIVLPIAGAIVAVKLFQAKAMTLATTGLTMPPQAVTAADVLEQTWQPHVSSVGSVVAVQGTVVSTEAEGVVREIKFEAGSAVRGGDELVFLDAEIERAQLRAAEAAAELARVSFNRTKELIGTRSISQAEVDTAD